MSEPATLQMLSAIEARGRVAMVARYQRTETRILETVETIMAAAKRAARRGEHEACGAYVDHGSKLWEEVADARALREAREKLQQGV